VKILFYSKEFVKVRDMLLAWAQKRGSKHEVDTADEETLMEKIRNADVLVSRPGAAVGGEILRAAPRLKLYQQWGAGIEGVDFETCRTLGIAVCNVPSLGTGNAESVAEIALLHLLLLTRKYAYAQKNARAGKLFSPVGVSLWKKTACVVGLGNLGGAIAKRLAVMGVTVRGVNRSPIEPDRLEDIGVKEMFSLSRLRDAVPGCRFVIAALALAEETRGLFDDAFFLAMDEGSFFINVARGGLVVEEALIRALDTKRLAGAGLDVLAEEPARPGNPLLTHPAITLTPHIGGLTDEARKGIFEFIHDNADRLDCGKELLSRQDK
jgi:phosphoglycerate dehydrogenase-like enzyme